MIPTEQIKKDSPTLTLASAAIASHSVGGAPTPTTSEVASSSRSASASLPKRRRDRCRRRCSKKTRKTMPASALHTRRRFLLPRRGSRTTTTRKMMTTTMRWSFGCLWASSKCCLRSMKYLSSNEHDSRFDCNTARTKSCSSKSFGGKPYHIIILYVQRETLKSVKQIHARASSSISKNE